MKSKNCIFINVVNNRYRVYVAPGPVFNDGEEMNAVSLYRDREIIISPILRPEDRLEPFASEVLAIWSWAVGTPTDSRGWQDLFGTVMVSLMRDLARYGGLSALAELTPVKPHRQRIAAHPLLSPA